MTPDAAADAIEAAFNTAWGVTTTIAWPNVPFTPPASANWVKVDFIWGDGFIQTKDGRSSVVGVLQLSVFGPKDSGDGALSALAETARAIVNRKRLAAPSQDVVFGPASGPVSRFEESWRALIVSAPFQVFETVS